MLFLEDYFLLEEINEIINNNYYIIYSIQLIKASDDFIWIAIILENNILIWMEINM
jgi:hypothetical protein